MPSGKAGSRKQLKAGGTPSSVAWTCFALLLAGLLITGLAIVNSTHVSRQRLNELQQLERQRNALQVEWGRLLLEQSSLVAQGKVEDMAVSELDMQMPAMNEVVVFTGESRP
jgi:cell division protein FtsL